MYTLFSVLMKTLYDTRTTKRYWIPITHHTQRSRQTKDLIEKSKLLKISAEVMKASL